MKETGKFGFWSIVLLGINGIVGTGIFLLPNKAYSIIGSASLGVLLFDAVIAGCIALCFAEAASLFTRNGAPGGRKRGLPAPGIGAGNALQRLRHGVL